MMNEDHSVLADSGTHEVVRSTMDEDHTVLAARYVNDQEEYVDETVAYTRYEWDCPTCGCSHSVEYDPSGGVYSCDDCLSRIRVRETM
jgi:hypothetical protein